MHVCMYVSMYRVDDILKKKVARESGLEETAHIARVQVESFLKALFCFVTHHSTHSTNDEVYQLL